MINKLSIQNYKSVKQLDIDCKKINVFIGEPNTGKSNILEALSFFSPGGIEKNTMQEVLRFETLNRLFYHFNYNNPIKIKTDNLSFDLSFNKNQDVPFIGVFSDPSITDIPDHLGSEDKILFNADGSSALTALGGAIRSSNIKTYYFRRLQNFKNTFRPYLNPPFGDNIPILLDGNPELKEMIRAIFREKGFEIANDSFANNILVLEAVAGETTPYPYYAISETLQRIVFITLAIESNKNATLVFDEPESNTFPFYTKYMAERMALDETNQFFITTHNPYLLMNIIEKAKIDDLNVFVARMENYETKVTRLNPAQLDVALDLGQDVFFNLELLTGE